MRIRSLCLALLFCSTFACENSPTVVPQIPKEEKGMENTTAITFDSLRAQKAGADDYGMKKYVMAFLKTGPNREADEKKAVELQAAHMGNIKRLAEAGKLVLAGPFLSDGELRGIYIFNVSTLAEAEALTNSDPAIQAGSLVMELHEWYGSAALMEVNEIHDIMAKVKF